MSYHNTNNTSIMSLKERCTDCLRAVKDLLEAGLHGFPPFRYQSKLKSSWNIFTKSPWLTFSEKIPYCTDTLSHWQVWPVWDSNWNPSEPIYSAAEQQWPKTCEGGKTEEQLRTDFLGAIFLSLAIFHFLSLVPMTQQLKCSPLCLPPKDNWILSVQLDGWFSAQRDLWFISPSLRDIRNRMPKPNKCHGINLFKDIFQLCRLYNCSTWKADLQHWNHDPASWEFSTLKMKCQSR